MTSARPEIDDILDVPDPASAENDTQRTFNPSPIGHGARIFQFDAKSLREDVSVPTLVGAMASSRGAPLSSREFDVITVLARRFLEAPDLAATRARREALRDGATVDVADRAAELARREVVDSGTVRTTMYSLCREIYGNTSAQRYRALGDAIRNLKDVTVSLPGFNAETGEIDEHSYSEVNLISRVVVTDQQRRFEQVRGDAPEDLARVFGEAKGQATLALQLDDWICRAITERDGADLNFSVQRALKGQAKTLWAQLEAQTFAPHHEDPAVEVFDLAMTDEVFAALGLHCKRFSDNVAKVRTRLDAIIDADPAYLSYRVVRDSQDRRRVASIVISRTATAGANENLDRPCTLPRPAQTTIEELVA